MLIAKSRYQPPSPFQADATGKAFPGIRPRDIGPATGVLEHTVQTDNRLDLLARHYYNNDRAWWRIVDANPDILFAGLMFTSEMEGRSILIPRIKD
jgi:hypothetical protein